MKVTGKEGKIYRDGQLLSGVKRFDFREYDGDVYGEKESTTNLTVFLDSDTPPIRQGEVFPMELIPSGNVSWSIRLEEAEVIDASIAVERNSGLLQELQVECYTTADIS